MHKLNFIDLFAGAGGLSEGFIRAGFEPIAHVEMDKAACYTLRTRTAYHYLKETERFDHYVSYLKGNISRSDLYSKVPDGLMKSVLNYTISDSTNEEIQSQIDQLLRGRQVDIIVGGPPCQAYSLVGRARSDNNMENDPRNFLFVQYANYLERYRPKLFVFENVLGLKSAKGGKYLGDMKLLFLSKGYQIRLFTLNASRFGVLQNRRRVIIVGWQEDLEVSVPDLEKLSFPSDFKVNSVLDDLPVLNAGEESGRFMSYCGPTNQYLQESHIRNGLEILTQHLARPHTEQDKEIYRIAVSKWNKDRKRLSYNDLPEHLKTHSNRTSFFDRFKVVAAEEAKSQTVVAHINKDGHYYIHPDIHQNRSLTVREAARLQSFPDDYYFEGVKEGQTRTAAFKQIGNAVPPLMAEQIAKIIKETICQK